MSLQPVIFPIDQPVMPEERQIGRLAAIDTLEARLDGAAHQWLIGERRIGKTSVAKAVLARRRKRGSVALDIDLSKLDIASPEGLAGEIARQAQAAHAGGSVGGSGGILGFARTQKSKARRLSKALEGLGFENEGQALAAVAALLAGADDGAPGLGRVLGALSLHARATGRNVVVLLDEVHLLADLSQADEQVARWCREPDCPIVFVFAGSEEAAVRALREPGRPLAPMGQEFQLADIAREDWLYGLRRRFLEAEVEIGQLELNAIISASGGHPRRTMLIASNVQAAAGLQPDHVATEILVELAIRDTQQDRAWR